MKTTIKITDNRGWKTTLLTGSIEEEDLPKILFYLYNNRGEKIFDFSRFKIEFGVANHCEIINYISFTPSNFVTLNDEVYIPFGMRHKSKFVQILTEGAVMFGKIVDVENGSITINTGLLNTDIAINTKDILEYKFFTAD